MKKKTRKKVVRRKRRVVRRNPGVKQGYALIRGGGPTGMKMVVVSTHKTREGAETAMIKKGGTPQSLFTKGYSIFAFGPGTRYEYLDTEFTGKFLRPIVGNRRRGLRGNPYVVKEGKEVLGRFDNRREARDYLRATAWKFGNFGPSMPSDRRGAVARMMDSGTSDLDKRMARVASLKMRYVRANPPMYAHGMTAHRTHGLSLKQMMKLYRLVSSGNPKAVMYARRTLGIPMSESLSQVKAVVYHHVLDLKGKI